MRSARWAATLSPSTKTPGVVTGTKDWNEAFMATVRWLVPGP